MRKEKEATKSVGQIALSFDKTTSWRAKGGEGEGGKRREGGKNAKRNSLLRKRIIMEGAWKIDGTKDEEIEVGVTSLSV